MKEMITSLSKSVQELVVKHRHHLHAHPELSFEEVETEKYIRAQLDRCGIAHTGLEGYHCVIGRIKGDRPGKVIALRADIDALPMEEKNEIPYRSTKPGVMHACGHDAHTAALLGLAELFAKNKALIQGEIVLIFQHAEEKLPGGAKTIVEHGVLDDVDMVFGTHMLASSPVGTVCYNREALTASADTFDILLKGAGGHGALPHLCDDALLAGTALVQQLQSVITRNVDPMFPAVLSVCEIHAGSNFNIIPEECRISGTVRTFDEEVRSLIARRIETLAQGIASANNLSCTAEYGRGYPATICTPEIVDKIVARIQRDTINTPKEMRPMMGGEDFSYYLQKCPGAFFFIGSANKEKGIDCAHHSPLFNIDERAISVALETLLCAYFAAVED